MYPSCRIRIFKKTAQTLQFFFMFFVLQLSYSSQSKNTMDLLNDIVVVLCGRFFIFYFFGLAHTRLTLHEKKIRIKFQICINIYFVRIYVSFPYVCSVYLLKVKRKTLPMRHQPYMSCFLWLDRIQLKKM